MVGTLVGIGLLLVVLGGLLAALRDAVRERKWKLVAVIGLAMGAFGVLLWDSLKELW